MRSGSCGTRPASFIGWYANLEEPRWRTPFGFDTTDHTLDIEAELTEAVGVGLYTPAKAAQIRAEGEQVIQSIEAWRAPFDEGWENWRPDPDWQRPRFPTVGNASSGP